MAFEEFEGEFTEADSEDTFDGWRWRALKAEDEEMRNRTALILGAHTAFDENQPMEMRLALLRQLLRPWKVERAS